MNFVSGLVIIAVLVVTLLELYRAYSEKKFYRRIAACFFGIIVGFLIGSSTGVTFGGTAYNGAFGFGFIGGVIAIFAVPNIERLWNKWVSFFRHR